MPFPPDAPEKVRAKIAKGHLPVKLPVRMLAGYGTGHLCDACEQLITAPQVEYEFAMPDGRIFRLHLGCAGLWEAERRRTSSAAQ